MSELNETVQVQVIDSSVVTVPIDTTLSQAGQAADAAAVGQALENIHVTVTVDGQAADNQGVVLLYGHHIPMSAEEGADTVAAAIQAAANRTGADIPVNGESGAQTVAEVLGGIGTRISEAVQGLYPVGIIVATTSATAPAFGFGTWVEIRITATWADLEAGNRNFAEGAGSGSVHYWRRTA